MKYSPGGLIDIEYAVQYLQLIHGHSAPLLRTPNTLAAIAALEETGILKREEVSQLREAYLFIRTLIDALRIVRGNARDLVLPPENSDAFIFLARRLGYVTERWEEGAACLAADITRRMDLVRRFFANRFGAVTQG